jgi:PAS domain S-box-containing protein
VAAVKAGALEFLKGGGDMGARLRDHDWSGSPLGDPETWPQSLKTAASLMLSSRHPMFLAWGPGLGLIYNDGYAPILGGKHPEALGRRFHDIWSEIWPDISPLIDKALAGEATWSEDLHLVMERNGRPEDAWFTFSYSPVRDESGGVGGMFCAVTETTAKVLGEQVLRFKFDLSERLRDLADGREVAAVAAAALGARLGAARVGYAEVDVSGELAIADQDWTSKGVAPLGGRSFTLDSFGPEAIADLRAGRMMRVDDIGADPRAAPYAAAYEAIGTRACLVAPLVKGGRLRAVLYVHDAASRRWSEEAVALTEATAERTWSAVERTRAEAALREGERRLRLVQAAGGVGSFDWDMTTGVIHRSPEYLQIQGLPPDSPLDGRYTDQWRERLHPDDRERVEAWFAHDVANPGPFEHEYRIVRPDTGETRWLLNRGRVEAGADGRPVRLLSAQTDITAAKRSEMRLRESEERLRLAQAAAGAGTFFWDLVTGEADLSPEYLQIMGFGSAAEVTREALVARAHPDDRERLGAELEQVEAGRKLSVSETRIVLPERRIRWVQSHARTWFDEAGRPVRRTGVIQDTTERRTAEDALRTSEQRFRAAVDAVEGVLWTNNARGEMAGEQPGWAALTGQTREQYEGFGWAAAVHPDDAQPTVDAWNAAVAERRTFVFEHRVRRADGVWRLFSIRAIPVLSPDGEVSEWVGVHTDITDRRAVEAAVQESEIRFRNMADHAPVMMWVTGPDGWCEYLNRSWYQFTGQTREEAEGFGWLDATHPDDRAIAEGAFRRATETRSDFRVEYRLRRADGVYRWAIDAAAPRFDVKGEFLGFVGSVIDIDDRREAELRLRESEENYRHAAELNPQVAWTATPDGLLDRVAERWREWTGTSGLGATWGEGLHPDDLPPSIEAWTRSVATGEPYDVEHRVKRLDGSFRWAHSRAYPRRDEQGAIVKWYGATEDVHERKLAEQAVRESETRLRTLTNVVPAFVWFATQNGDLQYFNDRWYEYTGLTPEQSIPDGWVDTVHPDDAERTALAWAEARAAVAPYEIEVRYRRRDGVHRWYLARAEAVRGPSGEVVGWFGTSSDIHEQKLAEAAVRESEARFRLMADNAPALIWATDDQGRMTYANRRYETHFGLEPEQILQEGWSRAVHPDDQRLLYRAFRDALLTRSLFQLETRAIDRSGAIRWLRSEGAPRFDGAGAFLGYVGCSVDITEARLAQDALEAQVEARTAELRTAEESLRQSQKMEAVGQLTGGIAHDFNNLLTAVVGGLDIIKRRTTDERTQRLAANALEAAERGVKLTGQLLAFSRTQRLAVEAVDINALIGGMRELIVSSIGGQVDVTTQLDPQARAALTDANQLELAVLNLCINARDAMPEGGRIVVATGVQRVAESGGESGALKPGAYVVVSVTDDGPGMDEEVRARAFDPFFTTKPVGRGTGLGLSQVYGIALQSGGEARIESAPGRGTTVRLYLPQAETDGRRAEAVAGSEAPEAEGGRRLVLVVDDDPDVRRFVVDGLDALGFRVMEAVDGPSGLELFRRQRPDLLLLDFAMPGMTGAEVAEAARRLRPDQPIVFASGYADTAAMERSAGDAVVLRKPFRLSELGAALERALAG